MHKKNIRLFRQDSIYGRFTRKVFVTLILVSFLCTSFSAAIIQESDSIGSHQNNGRGIIWDVTILSNNAGGQNDYIIFGEATDAHDGPPVDTYDVLKPPAPQTPYIRTWLNDNLPYPYDTLTMDYRSYPDSSKVWNLTIHWMPSSGASPTTITVSWNTAEFVGCEYDSVSLCNEGGTTLQNMLTNSNYIFSCPAYIPQNFKIICTAAGNLPPVANPDSYSANEDTTLTITAPGVLGNDNDPDSDPITAVKQSDPSHGSVTLNSNGGFTYIPTPNYFGSDSFNYKAFDGNLYSNLATVTITVNGVNDPPVANPDSYSTNEDVTLTIAAPGVLGNDVDADGNTLTAVKVTDPTHGSVALNSNGGFTYIPTPNYNGADSFTYKAYDGTVYSNTVTVSITINSINDPPIVTDIPGQTITEGSTFTTIALDNYVSDVDNTDAQMTWTYSGNTALTVSISGARVATITIPNADWYGSETITFRATDPGGLWDDDPATFTVTNVNDPPVVTDIPSQTIAEGSTFTTINLDNYVSDIDNPDSQMIWTYSGNVQLTVSIVNRVATITAPNADWYGAETITFRATDPGGLWDDDPATFTVTAVNDPPIVGDIPDQTVAEGSTFTTITLDNYVSDVDNTDAQMTWTYSGNSQLTVSIVNRVATITIPNADWYGAETITFRATDPGGLWDDDPATFTVTNVNDPPIVTDIPDQTIPEGSTFATINLDNYVSDIDNPDSEITWTYSGNVELIVSIVNRVATITIPNADWYGAETITFRATDPGGLWDDDLATFTVTAVNDAPIANPDSYSTDENTQLAISAPGVLSNDSDVDGDSLTAEKVSDPGHGIIIVNSNGSFTYTPAEDYQGIDTFTYKAFDGTVYSNIATVTITVKPVNQPPVVTDDTATVPFDSTNNKIDVLANDNDPDGDSLTIIDVSTASHGSTTTDGDYVYYTPTTGYSGDDSFTYTIDDGNGGTDTGAVSITVQPYEPEFSIQIKGGLGVKVVITNEGTSDATDIDWQIHVQGGIFRLINKTASGTIDIPAGESRSVSTGVILGLGKIAITTDVAGIQKTANGFVLFLLVLGVKENANTNHRFGR